jgi:hypothetical protein
MIQKAFGRKVMATAGTLVVFVSWHDPDDGDEEIMSGSMGLQLQQPLGLASTSYARSDGTLPIRYRGVFAGVTGTPDMSAFGSVVRLGDMP